MDCYCRIENLKDTESPAVTLQVNANNQQYTDEGRKRREVEEEGSEYQTYSMEVYVMGDANYTIRPGEKGQSKRGNSFVFNSGVDGDGGCCSGGITSGSYTQLLVVRMLCCMYG